MFHYKPTSRYLSLNNFIYLFQGCSEKTDDFIQNPPKWSAFRSSDYGYARLKAFNSTHLYFEQVSDDKVKIDKK